MAKFADIEHEIENVLDSFSDAEMTPEQQAAVDAYIAELSSAEADKIDAFCRFIRMKTATAEAKKKEADRLAASAKSDLNSVAYLKTRYLQTMQEHGLQKVKGNAYALSIRTAESVQIDDEKALPAEYITEKITVSPNKLMLKDALKSGIEIPGARLATSYSLQAR